MGSELWSDTTCKDPEGHLPTSKSQSEHRFLGTVGPSLEELRFCCHQ